MKKYTCFNKFVPVPDSSRVGLQKKFFEFGLGRVGHARVGSGHKKVIRVGH